MTESVPVWLSLTIILGCIAFPAGVRVLLRRFAIPGALSVAVCYAAGVAGGNIANLPGDVVHLLETLTSMTVAFWIPLLILPLEIRVIARSLAGSAAVAGIAVLSLTATGIIAFALLPATETDRAQLSAMAVALFSGGAPAADQFRQMVHLPALQAAQLQSAATVLTSAFVLLLLIAAPFTSGRGIPSEAVRTEKSRPDHAGFGAVLVTFGTSALIAGCGLAVGTLFPSGLSSVVGLLTIALLSTAGALIGRLRRAAGTAVVRLGEANTGEDPSLGEYVVLVFALVAGSLTSLRNLPTATLPTATTQTATASMWIVAAVVLFGSAALTLLTVSRIKPLRGAALSTVASLLASAPFAGPAAAAQRRVETLPGALAAGVAGYAFGSLLARLVMILLSLFR